MSVRGLLRIRLAHEHSKVSFIELFFDLVFVFAVTRLSHALIEHFSLIGALQTLLLMLAVWWVWIFTTWVTNWLDPEKLPVRLALMALMLLGLILSASIPEAFGARGWIFAGAYLCMQVGRSLFFIWSVKGHPLMVRNFQRILGWFLLSAPFWIAGAVAQEQTRMLLWALAMVLELAAPILGFWLPGLGRSATTDWNVEGGHMAERCGLFIIIALGESILVCGATLGDLTWSLAVLSAFVLSFIGTVAMWWLYFDYSAEAASRVISTAQDPGYLARLAYTYIHLFIVAGIIVAAVSDEFIIKHPTGHSSPETVVALVAGHSLYLAGNLLFRWVTARRLPLSPLIGILCLLSLVPLAVWLSPVLLNAAGTLVIVGVAAWEFRVRGRCPETNLER